jgi:hypothetical protein
VDVTPEQAEDWASEFAGSTVFSLLADDVKEQAPLVVAEALRRAGALSEEALRRVLLEELPALALPAPVRTAAPDLLRAFLEWLQDSGRFGEGYALGIFVAALAPAYRERCSPKGGLRTPPIVNKTAAIGRNDPCPCGSGKKYKKCCGA